MVRRAGNGAECLCVCNPPSLQASLTPSPSSSPSAKLSPEVPLACVQEFTAAGIAAAGGAGEAALAAKPPFNTPPGHAAAAAAA